MKILSAKGLQKSFGEQLILKNITFDIQKGEVLSIIGPSGSGKSTLLRCITQLESIDAGEIEVCGQTLVKSGENGNAVYASKKTCIEIGLHIGLVFQNFNLFPHYSVLENITKAPIHVMKEPKEKAVQRAKSLLEKMGLSQKGDSYPSELSGGQQQRVSIARALAMEPDILFFDEPTSALDPEMTGEMLKVLRDLTSDNRAMVVVTHEMRFAHDVADRVIFMDKGQIIETGTPKEVFQHTQNERTKLFLTRFKQEH